MSADNRDWYRDWWRTKTRYVERARFRMGEAEYQRQIHRAAWRRNFLVLGLCIAFFVLALFIIN